MIRSSDEDLRELARWTGDCLERDEREAMIRAFPSLARRYPTAESYARAPLSEVLETI